MKRFASLLISLIILLSQLNICADCAVYKSKKTAAKKVYKASVKKNVSLAKKKKLDTKDKKKEFVIPMITDDTAPVIDKKKIKKNVYKQVLIEDTALENHKGKKLERKNFKRTIISDERIVLKEKDKRFKKKVSKGFVDSVEKTPVVIKPTKKVVTKNSRIKVTKGNKSEKYRVSYPELGESVEFKVVKDVMKDGKIIIPKDSIVTAQVGEVSPRGMGGVPAELTLENFEIKDINGKPIDLSGMINSSGYNLSVWIGLAELATTPFLFGLAVPVLRVLTGGQAVITPRKTYVVYY